MTNPTFGALFPTAFDPLGSSFQSVLEAATGRPVGAGGDGLPAHLHDRVVDGTTVLAIRWSGGVLMAGDRRATAGNFISKRDMRKVFPADNYSAVSISGAAGPAMDMARVFATELEHYEKIEGEPLSIEGKANKLAGMVRSHYPLAAQGLVVVPLFCGVDHRTGAGLIFDYDPVGGRYAAQDHAASGSGSMMARQTLKRLHDPSAGADAAVRLAVEALYDAADDDAATGGPDLVRGIYPIIALIDREQGYHELSEEAVADVVRSIVDARGDRARGHVTNVGGAG